MEFFKTMFILISGLILAPAIIGVLWVIFMGGPLFLMMKMWEYFTVLCLNPIFSKINQIPFLGRAISFLLSSVIGLVVLGVIVYIYIPFLFLVPHALGN